METKDRIVEAAIEVYAEAGSKGATTRRIAERAGVNEVTLFRHFRSKKLLLREALGRAARAGRLASLPEEPVDPERELTAWSALHLETIYASRALLRTSMGEFEEAPEVSALTCEEPVRAAAELRRYLARLVSVGLARADVDLDAAAALLMGAIFSDAISRDMMESRFPYPLEDAAGRYVKLFLAAIGAEGSG